MINSTPGAILISIHQNKYPSVSPYGPQVFYGSAEGSDALAAIVQANLTGQLCPSNRRGAKPIDEDIFLMRKVRCTAVLTECGFVSNPDELAKLKTPSYRLQLASIFLASYLEYIRGTATWPWPERASFISFSNAFMKTSVPVNQNPGPNAVRKGLCLTVAAEDIDDFPFHKLVDIIAALRKVLTGIEVVRIRSQVLADAGGHSKAQV